MLPSNFGRVFDEDSFFSGHQQRMDHLFGRDPSPDVQARETMPYGMMDRPDDIFSNMMQRMDDVMRPLVNFPSMHVGQLSHEGGSGHRYEQSSVYSKTVDTDGKSEVYEAHRSNRTAPGGIQEERKAVKDTRREIEKESVRRQIGDRSYTVDKVRNLTNNEVEEHKKLSGLNEEDMDAFQEEWQSHSTRHRHPRVKDKKEARSIEHKSH